MVRKRRSEGQSRVSSCPSPTRCSTFDHHKAARYSTCDRVALTRVRGCAKREGRGERAENQKPTRRSPTPRASTDRTNASFCQSWATSRVPRGAKTARAGRSVSSSNVVLVVTSVEADEKAGRGARRVRIRQSPNRIRGIDPSSRGIDRRSGGGCARARRTADGRFCSRSEYFQGNVTDASRRSEAELACSEFDIVTTRTNLAGAAVRCRSLSERRDDGRMPGRARVGRAIARAGVRGREAYLTVDSRSRGIARRGGLDGRADGGGRRGAPRKVQQRGAAALSTRRSARSSGPRARPLPAAKPRVSAESPRKGLLSSSTLPLPLLASSRRAPRHVRTPDHALGRSRRRVRRGAGFERGAASRGLGRPGIPRLVVPVVG